jgi:hypothetical protein
MSENTKKPDNPHFEEERKRNAEYIAGLQQQVLQVALRYPDKYRKHQTIGGSYMNLPYEVVCGEDTEGDIIKARQLLYTVRDYGISDEDLSFDELLLLERIYEKDWRKEIEKLE